jgi:hypothetical protein
MVANQRASLIYLAGMLAAVTLVTPVAYSQNRLNDKDLQALMQNLRDDAKSFKPQFSSAISKSTIRKTSREKSAKNLVDQFQKQTEAMLNNFKRTKQSDSDVQTVTGTAQQIEGMVSSLNLGPQVNSSWQKIQTELGQITNAFGLAPRAEHYPRNDVSPVGDPASGAPACSAAVGIERAKRLVEECMAVSPATNPPCNVQNPCQLIIDEIKRGCGLLGRNAPMYCSEYR